MNEEDVFDKLFLDTKRKPDIVRRFHTDQRNLLNEYGFHVLSSISDQALDQFVTLKLIEWHSQTTLEYRMRGVTKEQADEVQRVSEECLRSKGLL